MRILIAFSAAVVILALAATGCSGDDNGPSATAVPQIRSQKGLIVAAAVQAGQRAQEQLISGTGEAASAPGSQDNASTRAPDAASYSTANEGITVTGYGMATSDADSAVLELYFSTSGAYPKPAASGGSSDSQPGDVASPTAAAQGISQSDLQPVIDAMVGAGVDAADIEYIGGSYYDPYYASATLRATIRDTGKLDAVVNAATDAASSLTNVYLQSNYVSYTMSDCSALESTAMQEAVSDADARSQALASALKLTRGAIQGASNDAYSPFGGTTCSGDYYGRYAVGGVAYAEGQSHEVTVYASVSITYAIK